MLDVLLEVVAPVLLVAAIGGLVGRRIGLSVETMSAVVFYLFSPALVFTAIADTTVPGVDIARLLALATLVFLVNAGVAFAWAAARRSDHATRAATVLSGTIVNQGNLGLPMSQLAFGDAGLEVAVVLFIASVVLWSTIGIALGSFARGRSSRRGALTAPLRYPMLYAAAAGAVVNVAGIELPTLIDASTSSLAAAAIPSMLVVLGLQFRRPRRGDLLEPVAASTNRLVIGPLATAPLAALLGLGGVTADTAVLMAGMPTAVVTIILAVELDARPELVVRNVVLSTLASVLTLTVLLWLVQ